MKPMMLFLIVILIPLLCMHHGFGMDDSTTHYTIIYSFSDYDSTGEEHAENKGGLLFPSIVLGVFFVFVFGTMILAHYGEI
jgi:hypothetical protein